MFAMEDRDGSGKVAQFRRMLGSSSGRTGWHHRVMTDRVGVLSSRPTVDGRSLLMLWDGRAELVEPGLADDELAIRFALDRIVHAPEIDFCAALHLYGPLAGTLG